MAKINVEFDTVKKTLKVVMDGKAIKDVSSVEFYPQYDSDGFHGSITTVEKMSDDSVVKVMRISAQGELITITQPLNLPKILANKLCPARMV